MTKYHSYFSRFGEFQFLILLIFSLHRRTRVLVHKIIRAFGLALHGVGHSKTPGHFGVLDWGCTPITGVQSASSSGVPYCTPWDSTPVARVPKWIAALGFNTPRPNSHSCVKSEWSIRFKQSNPVFKAKFGVECWLKNNCNALIECLTTLHTPLQQLEWSAYLSASIRYPKNGLFEKWIALQNTFLELECGLHSKLLECSNALYRTNAL